MSDHAFRELLGDLASIEGSDFDGCARERVANLAISLFGDEGPSAVALCALAARVDGRSCAYQFWFEVFRSMVSDIPGSSETSRVVTTASGL